MWRKKKWIIIAAAAAVLILVVGTLGVVAYAQTTTPTQPGQGKTILSRVATILGIDQKKVEDAFAQAQKEQQDDAVSARLQAMVTAGKLTQQQADDYKAWLKARPAVPPGLGLPMGPNMGPKSPMRMPGFRGMPGFPKPPVPSPTTQ